MFDYQAIKDDLRLLRTVYLPLKLVRGSHHFFEANPPLAEEAVRKFETKYGITLPEDYRGFLIHVGNGGDGPDYGVFKLGEMDDMHDHRAWEENDGSVGTLSKPFPHTGPWNEAPQDTEHDPDKESFQQWEDREMEAFDAFYWNSELVNGAIPICNHGCARRSWLVVSGTEAGNVWRDNRADGQGLFPHSIGDLRRVTFLQWYRAWLDEHLRRLARWRQINA